MVLYFGLDYVRGSAIVQAKDCTWRPQARKSLGGGEIRGRVSLGVRKSLAGEDRRPTWWGRVQMVKDLAGILDVDLVGALMAILEE